MTMQKSITRLVAPNIQRSGCTSLSITQRQCFRNYSTSRRLFQAQSPRPRRSNDFNVLDRGSVQSSISNDWKRMRLLGAAVVVCMLATYGLVTYSHPLLPEKQNRTVSSAHRSSTALKADAGEKTGDEFQGKPIVVIAGGAKVLAQDEKTGEAIELVPTGTSTIPHFPKSINLPAPGAVNAEESEYTLIGLGIRTVSFLSIQVYVVGLYVQTASLHALQAKFIKRVNPIASTLIPGEKDSLKQSLLDPEESYKLWNELLTDPNISFQSAFRIVPTRNTDFNHLRDGWVRGITARTQAAQQSGSTEFSDESFAVSMRDFNAMFKQKGKAPKGSSVIVTRDGQGKLALLYQEKLNKPEIFGVVEDERISRLVWLGYLGGKNVSSEGARRGIVDGVIELVERPVGTAAMKVS